MFTVHWFSLPMMIASLTSLTLAIAAIALPRTRTTTTKTFCMLNLGVASWTLAYALEIELSPYPDVALAPIGSAMWWVSLLKAFGLAATAVHWFMFAAAQSRRFRLVRGPVLWATIAFFGYTVVAIATNPLHRLYVTASAAGKVVDGPLRSIYLPASWLLMLGGAYLLLSGLWREPGRRSRARTALLAVVVCVPLFGGIASNIAQAAGAHFAFNPAPALFAVTTLVFAFDVFRAGLADIVPLSAAQAFQAMSDIAIVCDRHLTVLTANDAAIHEFPSAKQGMRLAEVIPEAAQHAEACLGSDCRYLPFELSLRGGVYWGRVYPTRGRSGDAVGCVIMLSDITDLRYAQERLADVIERRGPKTG